MAGYAHLYGLSGRIRALPDLREQVSRSAVVSLLANNRSSVCSDVLTLWFVWKDARQTFLAYMGALVAYKGMDVFHPFMQSFIHYLLARDEAARNAVAVPAANSAASAQA